MEDGDATWRIKCTSLLPIPPPPPPPLTSSSPGPPLPPPSLHVSPSPPSTSLLNQMGTNSGQFFRPFVAPRTSFENCATAPNQESLVFQTMNLDFAKSGKADLGSNSFLALLSGNPHSLLSEVSQVANLRPALAKVQAPSGGASGFVESKPGLISASNQMAASKQAFVGGNGGMATLSNSFQNVSQNHSLGSRASNGMVREAGSAVPVLDSGISRGRPHVMCMNTVGELFLTEMGILGIVCFCHNLHMSVGNFCKHSGCSANPGEAVRLVNGMTVARWCKQYFGSKAPDDCKGWDWSDAPSAKNGLIGCGGNTFPILPQNPGIAASPPTFVGLGKPGNSWNKSSYPNSPYISFGQAPIEHLANKDANNMNQRNNRLEGPNHSSKSFTIASQSHMPALRKNQTVNAVNESPDNHILKGKFGTSSFLYPYSDAKKSFPRDISRDGFTNDAFILAREGSSSKIDLRLGQPSQVHGSTGSFSTAVNPMQFAACNSQKLQVKRAPKEKNQPKEPKKPRLNLECSAFESPKENRGLSEHAAGGSNTSSNPGSEGFAGNPTKNSLISLLLSHLTNEGSNSSHITNTFNKSKHSVLDSASAKCNNSEHASDLNVGHGRKNILYGYDLSNNMDKEKQLRFDDRRFSLHFSESPRTLQGGSETRISSQYGKAPSVVNRGNFNHAINSSMVPFSCVNSTLGLPKSGAPVNSSLNSLYISEPTGQSHSKNIDRSQHLIDENMRFLALRHMVELSRQEKSVTSRQVSPSHQRLCCHLAGMEDLKLENSYGVHASQFHGRSEQNCNNCYSGNSVEDLGAKLGKIDQNEHCNCAALAQRSKEQDIPTCHACGADERPGLRLGGIPNSSGSGKQIFDQKEQTTPFHKRCCCSVFSNHMTQCCFSRDCSPSHSLNKQSICEKSRTITHICDNNPILQERMGICSCQCPKKQFFIKNEYQTGLWRDVPTKKTDNTDASLISKPYHLQNPSSRSQHESESMNEQQMSNVCSASSAPAITELSVEVNKVNYSALNVEKNKIAYEIVGDEGSVVEKCGSTDGEPGVTKCEGTLAVNGMVELPSHSTDNLNDDLKLDSSTNKKKLSKQLNAQYAVPDNVKEMKINKDVLVPKPGFNPINSGSSHCNNHLSEVSPPNWSRALSQSEVVMQKSSVKRKRFSLYSIEPASLKRDSHHNTPNDKLESDEFPAVDDDQSLTEPEIPSENEAVSVNREKQSPSHSTQDGNHLDSDKSPKYMSLSCTGNSDNFGKRTVDMKTRPVVCGKSGIISNGGVSGQRKPAKMVSLSLILKKTKRCDLNEGAKPKGILDASNECHNELCLKSQPKNEDFSAYKRKRRDPTTVLVSGTNKECFSGCDTQVDEFPRIENETDGGSDREEELALHHKYRNSQTKPRYREVRSCSLSKLLGIDKNTKLSYRSNLGASGSSHVNRSGDEIKIYPSIATGGPLIDTSLGRKSLDDEDCVGGPGQKNTERSENVQKHVPYLPSSDAACCVCGSSSNEDINCILECKSCLIRVHQACYGVSKVPKGHWYCRPCKTKAQKTVCVLCGYEGGAMTRAVKSQNIVQSLLKAWKFDTDSCFIKLPPPELVKCEASKIGKSCSVTALRSASCVAFPEGYVDLTSQGQASVPKQLLADSIIAGVLDPSAAQWVHMVCGLWTPGTRCPNVDTMSAFDVSGASTVRRNTVCSICNRPGGSCIRCRVLNCSVHFHPWCAHQKGLLQSEIEGENNDKIGFYGRCMHHALQNSSIIDIHPIDAEGERARKDWSSARTESFKGRKSDKGFKPLRRDPYSDSRGCIVSQEQINAWFHINGQKSARAVVKLPSSDVEYDCRKEYFRYKQTKAWKHLVVYKSGIHALGLYTSQYILRGAMVVEYVGEIVGQRVADKREIEYQTGRRLQYKSACYFFRIDKEHIIDATRKGGIARFVNHSCMPNCVAKVISVKNEKKVVFFAERDINPGEEITYDYHFNSEDEGQKIPCYCNSKNCRQYLN